MYYPLGSKGTPHAQANSSHKISPTTISSTPSPSPSSSSESCTTPTNELAERGLPAGASTNSTNQIKLRTFPSNSQPFEPHPTHVEAGILLSPQLKRTPRSFSSGTPIYRSGSLHSFLPKSPKQTFLQKKVPSVASRILQFEPLCRRTASSGEVEVVTDSQEFEYRKEEEFLETKESVKEVSPPSVDKQRDYHTQG